MVPLDKALAKCSGADAEMGLTQEQVKVRQCNKCHAQTGVTGGLKKLKGALTSPMETARGVARVAAGIDQTMCARRQYGIDQSNMRQTSAFPAFASGDNPHNKGIEKAWWKPKEAFVDRIHWQSDIGTACKLCNTKFGMLRWRHHCRFCGGLVCDGCSKHKALTTQRR